MLDTIGNHAESKRDRFSASVDFACAINEDARERGDLTNPAAIFFACNLALDHGSILRSSR